MSIRKRTYPSGKTSWYADWYDAQGRRRRKAFPTKKQAEDCLSYQKTIRFEEKIMGVKRFQKYYFKELKDRFLKFSKAQKKLRTYESYVLRMSHLNKFFSDKFLQDITPAQIDAYKTYRLQLVSPSTVNRELACLRNALNRAVEWGMIESIPQIKLLKEPPGIVRFLSKDEMESLLSELKNSPHALHLAVIIALNTGMRKGEILALQWKDIDLENRIIHAEKTRDHKGRIFSCKDNERRDLPINNVLYALLSKEKNKKGNLFKNLEFKKSWYGLLRRSNITNFRFHDLRHTFASYLVMEGVDITTVSHLLGHSKIQMTMKYAHLSPDHRKKALERIGNFIDTCLNKKK